MSRQTTNVGLNANKTIREAIQKIALHGLYDRKTGSFYESQYTVGFVSKIHADGEYAGTIDVTEYSNSTTGDGTGKAPVHENVWLSALQDNKQGYVVIPKLNSEVLIHRDPKSGVEFVVMASLVNIIQLESEEKVLVGVKEREKFTPSADDDTMLHEVELTGKSSQTEYTKDKIESTVTDGEKTTTETIAPDKFVVDSEGTKLQVEKDKIYLGSSNQGDTSHAVLGEELVDVLTEILQAIAQIKTTTSLGPQPAINMAQFLVLKQKISAFKTSLSGFLTNKVLIQK